MAIINCAVIDVKISVKCVPETFVQFEWEYQNSVIEQLILPSDAHVLSGNTEINLLARKAKSPIYLLGVLKYYQLAKILLCIERYLVQYNKWKAIS